jgi:NAD dependent epimerase/dehydratase family
MRILIVGASGAIGRPLVRRLRANQHEVFALTHSPHSAPALKEIGAEPVIADALDAAAVKAAVGRIQPDAVINELTSLPRHYTPAEMKTAAERDRKVRMEGKISLLAALRDAVCAATCCKVPLSGMRPARGWRTSPSRSSPAHPRESRPGPAPTSNWKRAHRRRQESSSWHYVTDSSTAPAPGTRPRAILVIRCGNSRFGLSVRPGRVQLRAYRRCGRGDRCRAGVPAGSVQHRRRKPVASALVADGVRACCRSTRAASRQRRRGASSVRPRRGLLRDEA